MGRRMRTIILAGVLACTGALSPAALAKTAFIKDDSKTCEIDMRYPVLGHPVIDPDIAAWAKGLADEFRDGCKEAAKEGNFGPGGKYSAELTFEIHRNDARAASVSFDFFYLYGRRTSQHPTVRPDISEARRPPCLHCRIFGTEGTQGIVRLRNR